MLFQNNETKNTNINLLNLPLLERKISHFVFCTLIEAVFKKKKVYRTKLKIILTQTTLSERCLCTTFRD